MRFAQDSSSQSFDLSSKSGRKFLGLSNGQEAFLMKEKTIF
jgi:hypothetical protein